MNAAEESNRIQEERKVSSENNVLQGKIALPKPKSNKTTTEKSPPIMQGVIKQAIVKNGAVYLTDKLNSAVSEDMVKMSYKPRGIIDIVIAGKSLEKSKY